MRTSARQVRIGITALMTCLGSCLHGVAAAQETGGQDAAPGCDLDVQRQVPADVEVGTAIELRLQARQSCYVLLALLDAHGVLELHMPTLGPVGPLLSGGQTVYLPTDSAAQRILTARLPYGSATLMVIGSSAPFPKSVQALFQSSDDPVSAMVASTEAAAVTDELLDSLGEGGGSPKIVRINYAVVVPAARSASYSAEQVVEYFTETTRSIAGPRLDVYVNFALNEADPLPQSAPMLELWGQVLTDPLLSSQRFRIGGHTDDLGSDALNADLSRRRAEAVRDILIRNYGVDASRLEVMGYGSEQPLVEGRSEEARAKNRRVDFERIGIFR